MYVMAIYMRDRRFAVCIVGLLVASALVHVLLRVRSWEERQTQPLHGALAISPLLYGSICADNSMLEERYIGRLDEAPRDYDNCLSSAMVMEVSKITSVT